jgi:hypothetical protein
MSAVGVITGVGNGVGVSVGGNHTTVGVLVNVGVEVFETSVKLGVGEGIDAHAPVKKQMIKINKKFFILITMFYSFD